MPERVGSILGDSYPELILTKQMVRRVEGIHLVRTKRDQGQQTLGFTSRPFVLCGLPIRRPPAGQLLYERRNGHYVLEVTAHPKFGLPFGQDRLVPIFLSTLAVRQQSQTIRFRSAAEMLDIFGMAKGGKEYRRLVAAFERIFGATIFFGTESMRSTAKIIHRSRFSFLSEAQIWYNRELNELPEGEHFENVITLSDEFYNEIKDHPIPSDLEAIKLLAGAPAVLDLFMWLTYRCFTSKGPEAIPIFGPYGLVAQLGSVEYSRPRRFRAELERWLTTIRTLWPGCPAHVDCAGRSLVLSPSSAVMSSIAQPSQFALKGGPAPKR